MTPRQGLKLLHSLMHKVWVHTNIYSAAALSSLRWSVGPSQARVIRERSFIASRSWKGDDFVQTCTHSPCPVPLRVPLALNALASAHRPVNNTLVPNLPDSNPKAAVQKSEWLPGNGKMGHLKRTVTAENQTVWAEGLSTCSDNKPVTY